VEDEGTVVETLSHPYFTLQDSEQPLASAGKAASPKLHESKQLSSSDYEYDRT
jgi:hypothetical protein